MMRQQQLHHRAAQRGVVLFVAMIVLVIMALAGVAMVKQSGTGLSIAGNLAFRQNATAAADLGTETAVAWWSPLRGTVTLNNDDPANAYFSDWGPLGNARHTGDPSQYDWTNWSKLAVADDGVGNEVRFIIERLCLNKVDAPDVPTQLCVSTQDANGGNQSGSTCTEYPNAKVLCENSVSIHYRISTRVVGPKNTVSYIQTMVH